MQAFTPDRAQRAVGLCRTGFGQVAVIVTDPRHFAENHEVECPRRAVGGDQLVQPVSDDRAVEHRMPRQNPRAGGVGHAHRQLDVRTLWLAGVGQRADRLLRLVLIGRGAQIHQLAAGQFRVEGRHRDVVPLPRVHRHQLIVVDGFASCGQGAGELLPALCPQFLANERLHIHAARMPHRSTRLGDRQPYHRERRGKLRPVMAVVGQRKADSRLVARVVAVGVHEMLLQRIHVQLVCGFASLITLIARLQVLELGLFDFLNEARQMWAVLERREQFGQRQMQVRRRALARAVEALKAGVVQANQLEAGTEQAAAAVLHAVTQRYAETVLMLAQRLATVRQRSFVQQGLQQLSDHPALYFFVTCGVDISQPVTGGRCG
ncbi:hypothetical protein ALO94_201057 [Pseudomonas syringae pv. spinaceae]|uniref:Phosphonate C-P lyase system protein PhnK n=1 Tax=Pseudomonas syringae pv. spinaceae TaxID=264459 RepID=A0A0N8SXS0_PSESX|nr:hypothetical protein ALO94_201057 [Pseudomonas syringae pv. spinaceae]